VDRVVIMEYTSKLIIKENAKEFNQAVKNFLEKLPKDIIVVSCDHSISFKTIAAENDALFSCMIILGKPRE